MFVFALASAVYADEVDVPFDFEDRFCQPTNDGKYICIWDPYGDVETTPGVNNNTSTETVEEEEPLECPTDRFVLNEVGDNCIPVEGSVNPELQVVIDDLLEQYEKDKSRFEKSPPKSNADEDYFELLKQLATCQRGTQQAEGIQQKDRFAISTTWVNDGEAWLKSLDFTGSHSTLKKAVEECKAQHTILEPVTLGVWYMDKAIANAEPKLSHTERAAGVPVVTQERVNNESNENRDKTLQDAQDIICDNILYGENIKRSYDCIATDIVNTNGFVKYDSTAWHKYQEYLDKEQFANVSVRSTGTVGSPVDNFIKQQGGYENAIDAIKWQQHYDSTNPEEMEKQWDE